MKRKHTTTYLLVLFVVSTLYTCGITARKCDVNGVCETDDGPHTELTGGPNIAIIGAGIGGSSTAYYIKKLIPQADITIYESNDRLCGRVLDFYVEGKKVEIGASIYHKINHNLVGFVKEFNLTGVKPFSNDSAMAIWDGKEFVHWQSDIPVIGDFVDLAKMFWRHGLSPYKFKNTIDSLLAAWSTLYEHLEPFYTTEELFKRISLHNLTQSTAPEYLESVGVARSFSKEMLGALTRVNYNTDVEEMNTFAVGVSAVGSGNDLYTVLEGNRVLCEKLLESAKANIVLSTKISSVEKASVGESQKVYVVNGKEFDAVVIAAPLELAAIDLPKELNIEDYVFKARQYREVHVSFIGASGLRPSYFHETESVPDHILTVEDPSVPFSSIGKISGVEVAGDRSLYKVFSRTTLSDELIESLFVNSTIVKKEVIKAYPILRPQQAVPIVLANKLFYVNSFESVVSTMETQTISGKNVAKLVAQAFKHPVKHV